MNDPNTQFTDDLVFDSNGNLYCADYSGTSVYKRTPSGVVSIFSTGFNTPNGMAFDSNGNMFMCDNIGNAIYKIDNTGAVLDTFPTQGPSGIIKDIASDTMIFTAYAPQSNLNKLAPDGTISSIHSGNPLNGPVGLAYIASDLYVGNFTDREIYKIEADTLIYVATVPGSGALGFIATLGNDLYGTCFATHKIYKIIPTEIDSTILIAGSTNGSVDGPISSATFSRPNGIVANPAGDTLYISQYGTGYLRIITGFTLGLESELDPTISASVYPNPTTKKVFVDLNGEEISKIEVYNTVGILVSSESNIQSDQFELELEGETGFYIVKVISGSHFKTFKILKRD